MFVVDTNILVYAANQDSPWHRESAGLVAEWRRSAAAWFLTWGICYEFLRVVTHRKVLQRPWRGADAWAFVEGLLASPGLELLVPTSRHATVTAEIVAQVPQIGGNRWHDVATAALMREHGVAKIYTRDTDFHRFPFLEPVDPFTPRPA